MRKQCELLGMARSSVDYQAVEDSPEGLRIKRLIDEIYLIDSPSWNAPFEDHFGERTWAQGELKTAPTVAS